MTRPIISHTLDAHTLSLEESLFHQANGYLGLRGYWAESRVKRYDAQNKSVRGSYLNAFYEKIQLEYAETLYGFPTESERLVALPDSKYLSISLNGQSFDPLTGEWELKQYERCFDLARGLSTRSYIVELPSGLRLAFKLEELVSLTRLSLYAQKASFELLSGAVDLDIAAGIDASVKNDSDANDPRLAKKAGQLLSEPEFSQEGDNLLLSSRTKKSELTLNMAMALLCQLQIADAKPGGGAAKQNSAEGCASRLMATVGFTSTGAEAPTREIASKSISCHLEAGDSLVLERFVAFSDSRRQKNPRDFALQELSKAQSLGWARLLAEQEAFLTEYWQDKRIELVGDDKSQQSLDFSLFHLLQNAAQDGISLIASKGLSGEGYEGHYFWDYEIFLAPYYQLHWPERAKKLLDYRFKILPQALENAKILGYKRGAQFAWRSITGPECSGYYPSGSAQVHINGDIAHAFYHYYLQTGDLAYMAEKGFAVILETARTWLELGSFSDGKFQIFGVSGPDEYTCLIDNNYFTNLSAQKNIQACLRLAEEFARQGIEPYVETTKLEAEEAEQMREAAAKMFLPYSEELGIDAQDDKFLSKPRWNFKQTAASEYPLLLHYHPSKLYRYQVLKQADTALAHFLYAPELNSPKVQRSRHYYEAITTHDSSLSLCIYGAMAAYAGEMTKAQEYFSQVRDLDLKDLQGNTADGLHMGNLGGTWLFLIQGFAGLRLTEDGLSLRPHLLDSWQELDFKLHYQGGCLSTKLRKNRAEFSWKHPEDKSLHFSYQGRYLEISAGQSLEVLAYQAIIFDLDGVLVHSDKYHQAAWQKLASEEGLFYDPALQDALRGVSRRESLEILLEYAGASKRYTEEEKSELATRKNAYYREFLGEFTAADFAPEHRAALKSLRKAGYKLGLASSSKNAGYILERLELTPYFDAITDGHDIEKSKPDPEVFLKTASALGVKPQAAMVIEDAESGLTAARAGDFLPIGFGAAAKSKLAAYSFQNLEELFAFFDRD